jgi:hypothetical protein
MKRSAAGDSKKGNARLKKKEAGKIKCIIDSAINALRSRPKKKKKKKSKKGILEEKLVEIFDLIPGYTDEAAEKVIKLLEEYGASWLKRCLFAYRGR